MDNQDNIWDYFDVMTDEDVATALRLQAERKRLDKSRALLEAMKAEADFLEGLLAKHGCQRALDLPEAERRILLGRAANLMSKESLAELEAYFFHGAEPGEPRTPKALAKVLANLPDPYFGRVQ